MPRLTKSQKVILRVLQEKGVDGITPKEILSEVDFAPRTVRYALRRLLQMNLVRRIPCLADMRQYIYVPS